MRKIFPFLLASLIFSSCGCILNYSRMKPPEIRNPTPEREITLVSFVDTTRIDYSNKKKRKLYKNTYKEFLYALQSGVDSTRDYSLKIADTLFFIPGDTSGARARLKEIYDILEPKLLLMILNYDIDRD